MSGRVVIVSGDDRGLISDIVAREESIFGPGGLNNWHLPYLCRYGRVTAVVDNSDVLGALELMASMRFPGEVYVVGLWVAPQARGRGLGRLLLREAIDHVSGRGARLMSLTCSPTNEAALRLYRDLGFREIERLADEYGPGEDRLVMRLDIGQ